MTDGTQNSAMNTQPFGMRTFYLLTITQIFSLIGSAMSGVAIGIRVFEQTGASSPLLLASFFSGLPLMLGGLFAGVLVDRWPRRRVLVLSDTGQALGTLALLICFVLGIFELWQLYLIAFVQGALATLQRPATDASVTLLVPEAARDRANALRQMTGPAAGLVAPVLAGALYGVLGVAGIMLIDLATFVVAVGTVLLLHIPEPARDRVPRAGIRTIWLDAREALGFLRAAPTLMWLMGYAALVNFLLQGPIQLTTPYVLTLTGSREALGLLLGALNLGIVIGGVLMGIWGGTRPRVHGIMLGLLFRGACLAAYGLARTPPALGIALFFVFFTNALIDASFMSILQLKVPPALQGRVFALLLQLMQIAAPLSLLITGPLVDRVLEPAVGGPAWDLVAPLLGSRPGAGMGLLMLIAGALLFGVTLLVYLNPAARRMERELPDQAPAALPTPNVGG
jgi:DHA3 family macrolide efflux protein-like MFS transporter